VLFSTMQTWRTSEGLQGNWVMLRSTDGGPAKALGEGIALDLTSDGRWALVLSGDGTKVTAVPTGVGQPRSIASGGLTIGLKAGRWTPDGKEVLAIGRAPGEAHAHLYHLAANASTPARISDEPLSMRGRLQVSPDGRWASAVSEDSRLVLISLQDGATRTVPQMETGAIPCGWSPDGSLWVTEV